MPKKIRIENELLLDLNFPYHAFFLLIELRNICVKNKVNIYTKKLLSNLNWKKNVTLKKYLNILYDYHIIDQSIDKFPQSKPLQFNITIPPTSNFTHIDYNIVTTIKSKIIKSPEKAIRLIYYLTYQVHPKLHYAFPRYIDIIDDIGLAPEDISYFNRILPQHKIYKMQSGGYYERDIDNNIFIKERNKYYFS